MEGCVAGEAVLIVEDDAALRMALADALASFGYEILEAGTGAEGFVLASQLRPALVLLDLGLPDMDGLAIAKRLGEKPETAWIAVAALTAEEISGERAKQVLENCVGYIPKPIGLDRLARSVALFLRAGKVHARAAETAPVRDDHPKRRYPRFNVQITAFCRLGEGRRRQRMKAVAGVIRNLSEGGLMLEFPQACTKEVLMEVSFRTDGSRLRVMSEVVWSGPPEYLSGAGRLCRHGLRFVGMSQQQQSAIRRFLLKRFTL
jgi:CheY-like chemotaxis protein